MALTPFTVEAVNLSLVLKWMSRVWVLDVNRPQNIQMVI
jgi:hypothetical protein